jgi:hypothetical protein
MAMLNRRDGSAADAKFFSQRDASFAGRPFANGSNLRFGQLRHAVTRAFSIVLPIANFSFSLCTSIIHVVEMCAKKQMFGVDAAGIIAPMENARSMIPATLGDFAYKRFVARTMGIDILFSNTDLAVLVSSWAVSTFLPNPALRLGVDNHAL